MRLEQLTLPDPVPANLLPAALPEILGAPVSAPPTVVYRQVDASGDRGLATTVLPPPAPGDTELLSGLAAAMTGADPDARVHLGPRVGTATSASDTLAVPPRRRGGRPSGPAEIGIVDSGIAFWNPAFNRVDANGVATSRFKSFGAVTLDGTGILSPDTLDAAEINGLLGQPDHEIRDLLRSRFPASVFNDTAPRPLFRPDGLAHGTAMADMVVSTAPAGADLHGLELPVSVLRDLTGGLMAAVMDLALQAVVSQAAAERGGDDPFSMVVLMAFGFTGGPQDGTAEVLDLTEQTLKDFAARNIDVTLVIPVGNHLQDQVHAELRPNQPVGWRTLPDDFSTNTLEIVSKKNAGPLRLTAPDGACLDIPLDKQGGLARILHNDTPIGAVWSDPIARGRLRTRISLAPSISRELASPTAPFGRWSVSGADKLDIWVLRDERGFEADPSEPMRPSWLEDEAYRPTDALGYPALTDPTPPPGQPHSVVMRTATASILSTSKSRHIANVSAEQAPHGPAFYSGLPAGRYIMDLSDNAPDPLPLDQAPLGPFGRRAVLGNGGPRRFRAAGTSLTAALQAGRLAG